jgi:hypothetical protein
MLKYIYRILEDSGIVCDDNIPTLREARESKKWMEATYPDDKPYTIQRTTINDWKDIK